MKSKAIQLAALATLTLVSLSAQGASTCALSQNENISSKQLVKIVGKCKNEAEANKLSYLPTYIKNQTYACKIVSSKESEVCLKELVNFSNNVLYCGQKLVFQNQMANYDDKMFADIINTNGEASIPENVQARLSRLIKAAIKMRPETKSLPWSFSAYNSTVLNAHAGSNSHIMLSAGLWAKDSPLTLDETTAIIAHEISHIIENHSLKLGCLALEWVGPMMDLNLETALSYFREDFSLASERGVAWTRLSQSIEYRADQGAVHLLRYAGLNPRLMAEALGKLRPKTGGGFTSGSHPEIDERIKAVMLEINKE